MTANYIRTYKMCVLMSDDIIIIGIVVVVIITTITTITTINTTTIIIISLPERHQDFCSSWRRR